ncbi:MAG: uracil-DNA glycosylase [Thermodesulfobacteriota bacterium]
MINRQTRNLLAKARSLLSFQQDMGVTDIPLTPEIEKFLFKKAAPTAPKKTAAPRKATGAGSSGSMFRPAPDSALGLPLAEIYQDIEGCTKCPLHNDREKIVPGEGPSGASLFIVEDQPSLEDEQAGHPFAGEAGELFDKMMKAINLERADVYLTSIVKCRPGGDRDPNPDEIRTCLAYLARQIAAVNPAVICAMGPISARVLTGNNQSLFRFRGKFHDFHNTPLMPTFHPRFLLKNNEMKKGSWADLQLIQKKLGSRKPTK